jgi:hypothetical protein
LKESAKNMGSVSLSAGEADTSFLEPTNDIVAELDNLKFARLVELAAMAQSLWGSILHAAERGEAVTVDGYARLAWSATNEARQLVKSLGDREAV